MPDIREVITTFSVKDSLSGPLKSLEGQSKSLVSSFGSMKTMVMGAVAALGVGGLVSHIIDVGSQAEQTSIVLGGMLTAFGYSGNMVQGMQMASGVMEQIEMAAARLPGEAQDYINVFQAGFAQIETTARATLGEAGIRGELERMAGQSLPTAIDQMTAFSNQITAIGATFGRQSEVVGRNLNLILQGRGAASNELLSDLMPYLRLVEGQANLTAVSLSHMTNEQRTRVLVQGMAKLQPMLAAAGNTWDAISGAMATTVKQTIRGATLPLFNEIKDVVGEVGRRLDQWKPRIVSIGAAISTALVGGFRRVRGIILGIQNSEAFQQLGLMARNGRNMLMRVVSDPTATRGAGYAAAGAAAGGPLGILIGGVVTALARDTVLLSSTMTGLNRTFYFAVALVQPLLGLLGQWGDTMGGMVANMLPGLASGLSFLMEGIEALAAPVIAIGRDIFTTLQPSFAVLGSVVGSVFQSIMTIVRPALQIFGTGLQEVWSIVGGPVRNAITGFVTFMTELLRGIAARLGRFGAGLQDIANSIGAVHGQPRAQTAQGQTAQTAAEAAAEAAAQAESRRPTTPAARAGHTTHNDFRHSRFDITQKFAEGFDPDRIAVGFVTDLERMSNARLTSGFSPLFGG